MATILLVIIYICFIGLGIPDSLFGSAWPTIYRELALPIGYANFVTIIISGCTILSSILSVKITKKIGTGGITAISTVMTAVALICISVSSDFIFICIFSVPLGLGAGGIDAALNDYVANNYKSIQMNFLHCFYGIGVAASPFLMSIALAGDGGWRGGYRIMFCIQLAISVIALAALPLWLKCKRLNNKNDTSETDRKGVSHGLVAAIKNGSVRQSWLVFFSSCAIEYTCSTWGSSYLVDTIGMAVDKAALIITFYYVGITLGRFLSGILSYKLSNKLLIFIGQGIVLTAIILLFMPLPPLASGIALFLIGMGNGPIFPNMLYLGPRIAPDLDSQAIISTQMTSSYIGILAMPAVFGLIAQNISVRLFPAFLAVMFTILLVSTLFLSKKLPNNVKE